jgi:hypothetical protein
VVRGAGNVSSWGPCSALGVCLLAAQLSTREARAEDPPPAASDAPATPAASAGPRTSDDTAADLRALGRRFDLDKRIIGTLEFGRGFRFNNPYRLATELGKDAQSVSLTAAYADLGLGVAFGAPDGLQHGAAVHASFAMAGVPQAVITPTYLMAYRGPLSLMAYARLGPSIILTPDVTAGGEVAGGFAWFVTGKLAVAAEIVFDLYYGAGTNQVSIATYPILSGQLGLLFDQEFLP